MKPFLHAPVLVLLIVIIGVLLSPERYQRQVSTADHLRNAGWVRLSQMLAKEPTWEVRVTDMLLPSSLTSDWRGSLIMHMAKLLQETSSDSLKLNGMVYYEMIANTSKHMNYTGIVSPELHYVVESLPLLHAYHKRFAQAMEWVEFALQHLPTPNTLQAARTFKQFVDIAASVGRTDLAKESTSKVLKFHGEDFAEKASLLYEMKSFEKGVSVCRNLLRRDNGMFDVVQGGLLEHCNTSLYGFVSPDIDSVVRTVDYKSAVDIANACWEHQTVNNTKVLPKSSFTNLYGVSALHNAAISFDSRKLEYLIDHGMDDLEVKDHIGMTPLHYAAVYNNVQGFGFLQSHGANSMAHDGFGRTPGELLNSDTEEPDHQAKGSTSIPFIRQHMESSCEFDQIDGADMTPPRFLQEYLSLQKPVLIRNAKNSRWVSTFTLLEALNSELANTTLSTGEIPYSSSFGISSDATTLGSIINQINSGNTSRNAYAFQSMPFETPLVSKFLLHRAPPFLFPLVDTSTGYFQFYLGEKYTGSPMHNHRSAWNLLIDGQKLWAITPPRSSAYSTIPAFEWFTGHFNQFRSTHPGLKLCIQNPGDVIFIPENWGHAVLNLQTSYGFASEITWGPSGFDYDPSYYP